MTASFYTQHLARAIGHAPSRSEALALWNAVQTQGPTVPQVLLEAISAHNKESILACKQKLAGKTLSPEEQGQALLAWRRSPSSTRTHTVESEQDIAILLACEGLITGQSKATQTPPLGPLTWLINNFREHAASALLEHIQPTQEDMAGALCHCVNKLATETRRDIDFWKDLTCRLLDKGANPDFRTHYRKTSSEVSPSSCAAQEVLNSAEKWSKIPLDILQRLLGKTYSEWTRDMRNGRTPLSQWINVEGDVGVAIALAKGQHLSLYCLELMLTQCVSKGTDTTLARKDYWRLLDGNIQIEKASMDQMTSMALCSLMPLLGKVDHTDKQLAQLDLWLKNATKYLPKLLPLGDRKAGKRYMETLSINLPKVWKAAPRDVAENRRNYFLAYLNSQMQANALALTTETPGNRSRGPRL